MKTKEVYIKIRLQLKKGIDVDEVRDFVNDLSYDIGDEKKNIRNIEIVDCDTQSDF